MNAEEMFEIWAPRGSPWAAWAKPVLFAQVGSATVASGTGQFSDEASREDLDWAPRAYGKEALVIDTLGERAVAMGLALAASGWRPVPLFNGCDGPSQLVNVTEIAMRLAWGAQLLQRVPIPAGAPPVFLLDSRRMAAGLQPAPGTFDNRWMTFPQDFPSARFLKAHGITEVTVAYRTLTPAAPAGGIAEDLCHVLRRWQEDEIRLSRVQLLDDGECLRMALDVPVPSSFRKLLYRFACMLKLHPASAGGFGSVIPHPSSGSGGVG